MNDIHQLLREKRNLVAIGAHDGLTARLGERAGFDLIWGSGFEISASYGVPDANIITMSEQLRQCDVMNDAVGIPVIADCDNGFGNAINAAVTVRKFERAGIAGVCIEDNSFPKRCSFYEGVGRELVPLAEHALKIRACREAQQQDSFFVIARTEALVAGEGVDAALTRASAYAEAGAHAVLVHSKSRDPGELVEFARQWDGAAPLVAVPTTYDEISAESLHQLGYRIVIFANQALRSAIKAMERNLATLRAAGRAYELREGMVDLDHVFELVGLDQLRADEARYLTSTDTTSHRQTAHITSGNGG
jgi:phosphoenolpyruvate phosphomutase